MIGDLKMAEIITLHKFGRDYKRIFLDLKTYMKAKAQIIQPGDILFSIKATIGKASLVDEFDFELPKNTFFTANQNMLIFRMRKNSEISPQALLCFLSNDVVNAHLNSLSTGSTLKLPMIFARARSANPRS